MGPYTTIVNKREQISKLTGSRQAQASAPLRTPPPSSFPPSALQRSTAKISPYVAESSVGGSLVENEEIEDNNNEVRTCSAGGEEDETSRKGRERRLVRLVERGARLRGLHKSLGTHNHRVLSRSELSSTKKAK